MHAHWNSFLDADLLTANRPPARLVALAKAGVTHIRIPIGYWAFQAPTGYSSMKTQPLAGLTDDLPFEAERAAYEQRGLTAGGFVTGGTVYLRALLRCPLNPNRSPNSNITSSP